MTFFFIATLFPLSSSVLLWLFGANVLIKLLTLISGYQDSRPASITAIHLVSIKDETKKEIRMQEHLKKKTERLVQMFWDLSISLQRTVTLILINNAIKYQLKELWITLFFDFIKMWQSVRSKDDFVQHVFPPSLRIHPNSSKQNHRRWSAHGACVCYTVDNKLLSCIFRLKRFIRTAPSSPSTSGLRRCVARRGGAKRKTRPTTAVSSCVVAVVMVMLMVLVCVSLWGNLEALAHCEMVFNRQECGLN